MTTPMQSEPRHHVVSDYYVKITGVLHDMTEQDVQHFSTAMRDHIQQYGGRPFRIELEELG